MRWPSQDHAEDRRNAPRLAAEGSLHATVLDDQSQPLILLRDVEVVNVSAGGLAFITATAVTPASVVSAFVGDEDTQSGSPRPIRLEVLDCTPLDSKRYRVRCRLVEGNMPARLIADWFAGQGRPMPA